MWRCILPREFTLITSRKQTRIPVNFGRPPYSWEVDTVNHPSTLVLYAGCWLDGGIWLIVEAKPMVLEWGARLRLVNICQVWTRRSKRWSENRRSSEREVQSWKGQKTTTSDVRWDYWNPIWESEKNLSPNFLEVFNLDRQQFSNRESLGKNKYGIDVGATIIFNKWLENEVHDSGLVQIFCWAVCKVYKSRLVWCFEAGLV